MQLIKSYGSDETSLELINVPRRGSNVLGRESLLRVLNQITTYGET